MLSWEIVHLDLVHLNGLNDLNSKNSDNAKAGATLFHEIVGLVPWMKPKSELPRRDGRQTHTTKLILFLFRRRQEKYKNLGPHRNTLFLHYFIIT